MALRFVSAATVVALLSVTGCGDAQIIGGKPARPGTVGLPCEVASVIQGRCASCHGDPLAAGAPYALLSRDGLVAQAPAPYQAQTVIERSLARIDAGTMPPGGGLTSAEVAGLSSWAAAGAPQGACAVDVGPVPTTCASGVSWTRGNDGSADMNPGLACRACHLREDPDLRFFFSGTVFPSLHERDLCDARSSSAAEVQILDAAGTVQVRMPVSLRSGNFRSEALTATPTFAKPWKVKVVSGARSTQMQGELTDGDCNGCHTEQGANGAPGRIAMP